MISMTPWWEFLVA